MTQPDFFAEPYPETPGSKGRLTSGDAARGMAPKVGALRERVLAAIKVRPGTPEQIAHRIGEPLMNVRPRTSELAAKGLIEDSGVRGQAMGGREAIVWRAVVTTAPGGTVYARAIAEIPRFGE